MLHEIGHDETYATIAVKLGLATETVKTYAKRLTRKLVIRSKHGLAIYAFKHSLVKKRA